jgi:allantoinase
VHILHLSSADGAMRIAAARHTGLPVTAETCPHYLTLAAEDIPDGATEFKCCPPIRDAANRERLWAALAAGTIETIASDHSPCTADLKDLGSGDFDTAWGGISSLQLGFPLIWTEARRRGHSLARVAGWMSTRPAQVAGLAHKGRIAVGYDADFAVVADTDRFTVRPELLHHKNPTTPYTGRTVTGVVRRTLLRGIEIGEGRAHGGFLARQRR